MPNPFLVPDPIDFSPSSSGFACPSSDGSVCISERPEDWSPQHTTPKIQMIESELSRMTNIRNAIKEATAAYKESIEVYSSSMIRDINRLKSKLLSLVESSSEDFPASLDMLSDETKTRLESLIEQLKKIRAVSGPIIAISNELNSSGAFEGLSDMH